MMGKDDRDHPAADLAKYKLSPEELAIDIKQYRITPAEIAAAQPKPAPAPKRQFVMVPMDWLDQLAGTSRANTYVVALHLLHLNWKNDGQPFLLPNGKLEAAGVSRFAKWRALKDLEQVGLIAVEKRPKRSPKITVRA
jgi:hypothetical protein